MTYDFRRLSPHDLELLARDLLQAAWGVELESFKTGRDGGIDLRYARAGANVIVQCKHYVESGIAALRRAMRGEAEKIDRLDPERYVVATSVPLSPGNKDAIVEVVGPSILSPADVLGAEDLNNLLALHPEIEKRHFKLWLASSAVLERVLHNASVTQSEFKVEQVHRDARRYVQSAAYSEAMDLLDRHGIVIVAGPPGVGKTTLADLLLYRHLERGYQAVLLQGDAREGADRFQPGTKQVFHFDDFLGATFLGDTAGVQFNKDMVLKAALLISDVSDIRFRVTNFNRDNMEMVERKWDLISESLTTAVQLISSFGFSGMNFANQNAVMIIAYFLSRQADRSRVLDESNEDRRALRMWLLTVLVKRGLWVSTDALLGRARNAIRERCIDGFDGDTVASAMAGGGGMYFTDEEIEDLADTSYGDWSTYSLLSLLFDHVDTANSVFHIDHVVARAQATSAKMDRAGLEDGDRRYVSERINRLPNLQLLNGRENKSKSATLPRQWIASSGAFADDESRDSYAALQDLGDWRVLPEDLYGFRPFYDARRRRVVERLKRLLPCRQTPQEAPFPAAE
ncbi:MAG: hypothetical protein F4Y04_04835 [Chloroflexi bacterium]|nr:hypothetical protein [Chloroflexota bacterium]